MIVNYPLSRELGIVAKVYLIACSQNTCARLKKYDFCPRRLRWNCPYICKVREGEIDRGKVTEREIEIMLERRREKDKVREGR